MELHEKIKSLREAKFKSQYAFAKKIGEHPSTVRDIESGKQGGTRGLSVKMLNKIAEGLDCENLFLVEKN